MARSIFFSFIILILDSGNASTRKLNKLAVPKTSIELIFSYYNRCE